MGTTFKFLNQDEKQRLFDSVDSSECRHKLRNRAILSVALYCGLRVSELTALRLDNYNRVQKTIFCPRLKNGYNNTLRILDDDVLCDLNNYLSNRPDCDSPYLFLSQERNAISRKTIDVIMKKYGKLAGLSESKRHFHVLRHTRAIELAEAGLDVKDVQFWLGHRKIDSTLVYLQYTTKQHEAMYQKLDAAYKEGVFKYE